MAYIIQSFQKFSVLLFVRIPCPNEESHMQICSESTDFNSSIRMPLLRIFKRASQQSTHPIYPPPPPRPIRSFVIGCF